MTRTMKNTLISVLVLFIISASSVLLLALANNFIKVEVKLDAKTATLINTIAPTGYDDATALKDKHIKMVDLANANYNIKSFDEFNKTFGTKTKRVQALYLSTNKSGKTTVVVQAEGAGFEGGQIVMLTAYDDENKISGIINKSQSGQSYWVRLGDMDKFYQSFIGKSGSISSNVIAGETGATVMGTLRGITDAVSISNVFAEQLGEQAAKLPEVVNDPAQVAKLKKVSGAAIFTQYFDNVPNKISNVYVGDNDDIIYESMGDGGGEGYGRVTLLVTATSDKKVKKITIVESNFTPGDGYDSSIYTDDYINKIFAGKDAAQISGLGQGEIAGSSGATESAKGLKQAVLNALDYIDKFDKGAN